MIGTKLAGRYEILREIGRGGMGVVYLAQDPVLDREVAIKVITPDHVSPESVERFKREARVVAKMDHPAIVSVYDSGEDQGLLFFVMPFVEGKNLRAMLRVQTLTLGDVIWIGNQVASALEYSHQRGIIHRDIKPENIMVTQEEADEIRVRVTDFGLAMSSAQDRITKTATVVGTVAYMSPEQVSGREVQKSADIYSLGTVLYECLAGQTPFSGEVHQLVYRISHEIPVPLKTLQGDVDDEIEELLSRCLEKEPSRRPTGKEVADALSKYRNKLRDSGRHITILPTASAFSIHMARPAKQRPFVGREKEFAELQRRLNAAISGECQFVLVSGEAGIGKTRLLEELETLTKVREIAVLHGRFVEANQSLPYQAFCEVIQEYFRTRPTTATPADFSDLAPDLVSLFPVLSEIKDLSSHSNEAPKIQSEFKPKKFEDKTYIFELLSRAITRCAGGKPLLLMLEDLHAADVSIDALDYLVRRLGPTPTLIVGTYRSTEVDKRHRITRLLSNLKGDRRFALISLVPLSASSHRLLLEKLIGGASMDETLAHRFFEVTEGNPYFTAELVRSLIDSGGIVQDDTGVYKLSSDAALSVEEMPATIQQAVEERIERLPADVREVLSIASVFGKTFEFSHLQILAAENEKLEDAVEHLLVAGFLEEDRHSRELRFSFSSGVVRDVLYGSIHRLRRRAFHKKYAQELERRNRGRLERFYAQLFEHYSQADVTDKVIEYGFLLAKKSLESFSAEDAVRVLQTVLDSLEFGETAGPSERAEAKMLLSSAHRMTGNTEEAGNHLDDAIGIFESEAQLAPLLNAMLAAADLAWQSRKIEETRRRVERAIELARKLGDTSNLSKALSFAATIANFRGEHARAREYFEEIDRLKAAPAETKAEVFGGSVSVALSAPCVSQHPVNSELLEESEVYANVFETIVITDDQGNLIPHLCERWESLNDAALFLFILRKDVTFSNGKKLTAVEIKTAFETAIRHCTGTLAPAFAAIQGASEFAKGGTREVTGLVALSDNIIQIQLSERLALYPALLTDFRTAITDASGASTNLQGTGPFLIVSDRKEEIELQRNPNYWKGTPPYLDSIHFHAVRNSSEAIDGFRTGRFDLIGQLPPQDLDAILRDRRSGTLYVEAPQKNVYFGLFNQSSPVGQNADLRKALTGVIRQQDLIRSTLGRLAQPATGILPPGIRGHDPGKRRYPLSLEEAARLVQSCALPSPVRIRAALHPAHVGRYGTFTDALLKLWKDLGVEVTNETPTMESFLKAFHNNEGIDLILVRWIGDYDDPDTYTYALFHSEIGTFCKYFSSPHLDTQMTAARLEKSPAAREKLYLKIETDLMESGFVIPFFHDLNYRLVNPQISGLTLSGNPPYVNYAGIMKEESRVVFPKTETGILRIPLPTIDKDMDPHSGGLVAHGLAFAAIYETLTVVGPGGRVIPWLASSFQSEEGGKRYRFRLRDGVRFHDGRRLTSRDVRYSFERLLTNRESIFQSMLSCIRGADRLIEQSFGELEGFRILSTLDFIVELDQPLSYFLSLLSGIAIAILPEGADPNRDGKHIGTGPFRMAELVLTKSMKVDANHDYWRPGFPRVESIEFIFGQPTEEIMSQFQSGRLSIAWHIPRPEMELLLHDRQHPVQHFEIPGLSTFYLVFNHKSGVFSDASVRQRMFQSLNVEKLVHSTLGRFAVPARTFIPPALLNYEPDDTSLRSGSFERTMPGDQEVTIGLSPSAYNSYRALVDEIGKFFETKGLSPKFKMILASEMSEFGKCDCGVVGWTADYPDPNTYAESNVHSKYGVSGHLVGSPELDRLIEQGKTETDPVVRQGIYRQFEQMLRNQALLLPLFHNQINCFARPEVEGVELDYMHPYIHWENLRLR